MDVENLACTIDQVMYNTMTKTYRDGSKQIICATKRVFREPGWTTNLVYGLNRMDPEKKDALKRADLVKDISSIGRRIWGEDESYLDLDELDIPWYDLEPVEWTDVEASRIESRDRRRARDNLQRSMRRAKVRVRDYCLSTDMKYFCTFTLDKAKIDRYDIKVITRKLNTWLNHQVERRNIAYVMVPELHQDGAIHFHGMLTDGLDVVDSGTIIPSGEERPRRPHSASQAAAWLRNGGRRVYNLPGWPYGFTTALQLEGCYEKAVNYVCKYISKGLGDSPDYIPQKVGGRWYYSGGDLGKPDVEYFNSNMEELQELFGDSAHVVDVSGSLSDVEMIVVWVTSTGVPR